MISRINLIGAFCNLWGVEHHIFSALKELGYSVKKFDHRREEHLYAIDTLADMTLVLRGDRIAPTLIERFPRPTVLWHGEIIHPSAELANEVSKRRTEELAYNVKSFDFVFHQNFAALETIRGLGAKNVFHVSSSGVNPQVHRKLNIPKIYDVGFTGTLSPRREEVLNYLRERGINVVFKEVYGAELNYFINQCKIFLNIHFTEIPIIETRLDEILGAGSFTLSEEISMPDMYLDGKHLVYWKMGDLKDLEEKIGNYLQNEEIREWIALNGYKMVYSRYKFTDRCKELIKIVKQHRGKVDLSRYGDSIGVMFDKNGHQTFNLEKFYLAVKDRLESL